MAMCISLGLLWATDSVGHKTWHLTIETGHRVTQNNYDLTLSRAGAVSWSSNHFNRWTIAEVKISYWMAMLITALLPGVWLRRAMQSKQPPSGLCKKCGYDLRATPGRCPECGNFAAK